MAEGSAGRQAPDGDAPLAGPIRRGRDRTAVELVLHRQGRDLVLTVSGGVAHVGAVAVDSPAGGTRGESFRTLDVVPGHKEGELAARAAARLAEVTGRTVVAVVGIHQDAATGAEIAEIVANVEEAVALLASRLGNAMASDARPVPDPEPKESE
jgi:hypothetical protein